MAVSRTSELEMSPPEEWKRLSWLFKSSLEVLLSRDKDVKGPPSIVPGDSGG